MTKKNIEPGQSGVGDISDIIHSHVVSDLSWLDVDIEDYHRSEALPKQNLDIIPDLQRALTFENSNVPSLIPLKPHTIVNTNPLDPPGAPARNVSPEITSKVARYVISGHSPRHIGEQIMLEFAPSQIREASSNISAVLSERGLLGNVYIDARHFPRCAQDSDDKRFVAAKAASAKFILAKKECAGCVHNRGGNCANLHKRLVVSVSYDRNMFASYAMKLSQEGRLDKSGLDKAIVGSDDDRKLVLASSFQGARHHFRNDSGSQLTLRHQDKEQKPVFSDKEIVEHLSRSREAAKTLTRSFIAASRHLMAGKSPDAIAGSSDPEVRKLVGSYGLLGHTYLDMDAIGGCQKTLNFIAKMDAAPDFVIRRSACCGECKDAFDGACCQIKSIVPITDSDEISREHFVSALLRAADRGAITIETARRAAEKAPAMSNWKSLTSQANLLKAPKTVSEYVGAKMSAHYGSTIPSRDSMSASPVDAEDVRRTISHLMNSGLRGKNLKEAVLKRYARSDLKRVPQVGARLARYDGVQGSFFIDPTAYVDYGRGCVTGAKHFRKQGAANILVGSSCVGCSMQTAPGWCSKYSKSLVRKIPDAIVVAAQELRETHVPTDDTPVENPVDKYELSSSITVEPDKKAFTPAIDFADRNVTE
jgi:hypothetical protein